MGDWWIDEEPYAGPSEHEIYLQDFAAATARMKQAYIQVGRAYGKAFSTFPFPEMFEAKPAVRIPPLTPVVNNTGPRPNRHFDRRGNRAL